MVDILLAFLALAFVALCGILFAVARTHGNTVIETFISVVEAIQDIKAFKASRMK